MSEPVERFFAAKMLALLHDPPHKMWILHRNASSSGARPSHEEIAKSFAELVLGKTSLSQYLGDKDLMTLVKKADVLASGFDRFALMLLQMLGKKSDKYFVWYTRLHNVFYPKHSTELNTVDIDVILERAATIAKELGNALSEVEKASNGSTSLVYRTLYALLETLWYLHGLPPSLADTRMPTHTVFDHLYATATCINMLWREGSINGWIVRIDFPGIHRFIDASRKACDYWAASWILSNVTWNTIYRFVEKLGPDVVIAPSTRLNPYLFAKILKELKAFGCSYVERIEAWFTKLLKGIDPALDIATCLRTPLIPAQATLILPRISLNDLDLSDASRVVENVQRFYDESWRELAETIIDKLGEAGRNNVVAGFAYNVLMEFRDIVTRPIHGLRIEVVDLKELYHELRTLVERCWDSDGDAKECSSELLRLEGEALGSVVKILRSCCSGGKDEDCIENLVMALLFHVALTRSSRVAKCRTIPTPRAFWILKNGTFASVMNEIATQKSSDWIPCPQCGLEPVALRLPKTFGGAHEDYNNDAKRALDEVLRKLPNVKSFDDLSLDDKLGIRKLIRPGEALGPYCLFKRFTYLALRSELGLKFVSTDDVALKRYVAIAKSISRDLAEKLAKNLGMDQDDVEKCLELIGIGKELPDVLDIESVVRCLDPDGSKGISLDKFRDAYRKSVKKIVEEKLLELDPVNIAKKLFKECIAAQSVLEDLEKRMSIDTIRRRTMLERLLDLRTVFAILYGDGDNIGKVLGGRMLVGNEEKDIGTYFDALYNAISTNASVDGIDREQVMDLLRKSYDVAKELCKAVDKDGKTLIVSPARYASLSLSLIVTALKDLANITRLDGMTIYAGGDDILALLPIETIFDAVAMLRMNFSGDGKYFHGLQLNNSWIPVASALVSGRSFSLRIASLMDLLSEEISMCSAMLEVIAKNVRWRRGVTEWSKDALVISHSRSNAHAVLPLSVLENGEVRLVAERITRLLLSLYMLRIADVLSSSLPEDLDSMLGSNDECVKLCSTPKAVKKFVELALQRNLKLNRAKDLKDILVKNWEILAEITLRLEHPKSFEKTALLELINAYRIVRGLP